MLLLAFLIAVSFACYRVSELLRHDAIAEPVRKFAERRKSDRLTYFLDCPWCISIWAAAALWTFVVVTIGDRLIPGLDATVDRIAVIVPFALASSAFTGWVSERDPK